MACPLPWANPFLEVLLASAKPPLQKLQPRPRILVLLVDAWDAWVSLGSFGTKAKSVATKLVSLISDLGVAALQSLEEGATKERSSYRKGIPDIAKKITPKSILIFCK